MIKFFLGDEPYWIDSEIKKATEGIQFPDMNLMKADRLDDGVFRFLEAFPFMDAVKAAVVTLADLSEADKPELRAFDCPECATLVVRCREYDARKTFFKELKKNGLVTLCTKQALGRRLEGFILQKAGAMGVRFETEAFQEFLFRENYQDADEVNCYSLLSDLDSLAAVSEDGVITTDAVKRLVDAHVKGNPFVVAALIKSGNVKGLLEQAQGLSGQEIPSLAALLREYRIAWKSSMHKLGEIGVQRNALEIGREEAAEGIRILTAALRSMKSDAPKGTILEETYLKLAAAMKKK